ncbi:MULTISPECIES: YibE/F family protein [Aminobacterium]|jgi:uncharacterized membrane protein|uniref:YibE/F family protein n=1 Tax=Aminobacterium colombiense (strain DSM 12261 / ALA-1) TaxID=572547 RepID=D5EGY1_AMICL|nr:MULTISPECIES: YibE/F family protein [Aminobacterium]MDD2379969.1 YibE/F family protein [Aminobacterium colombiense]ADE57813.1 YibE/F family protein [Aminobacterium colombiense DSM 12261]MDD3768093.1 YibE/F family protein [Aminobacterium colombiense]MDD4265460.1 YibE/F family protein [Aminobacterium colombiense]MDD4586697.1 YibE/F family protein [Aminobacterium colombiense]
MKKIKASLLWGILFLALVGFWAYENNRNSNFVRAVVLSTDNSDVMQSGIARIGSQELLLKVVDGKFKGQEVVGYNNLLGNLDIDAFYAPGDTVVAALREDHGKVVDAKAVDLYRQSWEFILFGFFVLLLIIYAGNTGLRAIFSFIASLWVIWKNLIPGLLAGENPLLLSSGILFVLSAIVIFSVAGFTRKGLSAFLGTVAGLFVTIGITAFFGDKLGLLGTTLPYSSTLLFSGNIGLNMKQIFFAAIVIGASGAAMDIGMDIASAMAEVKSKKPEIMCRELIQSGFNVGRAVIGTMTTTLLLAYSGGYLTLLMLFASQDTDFVRIINYRMVAAEILRTVAGSIGLVLIAPITAVIAGWIYSYNLEPLKSRVKSFLGKMQGIIRV